METGDRNTDERASDFQGQADVSSNNQYVYNLVQIGSDQSFVVNIADSAQLLIQQLIQQSGETTRSRTEKVLLTVVKEEVIARLKMSLHHAVFIQINMEFQPSQVLRPSNLEIMSGGKSPENRLESMNILEIFDQPDISGKLLILGSPGSGKTTTMLKLAEALIERAEQEPDYPVPVIFNLSSWRREKGSMADWLSTELKLKYGVRKDIGQKWINNHRLIILLDGLDELKFSLQEPCIYAINNFLRSENRPEHIVVCSRLEEYSISAINLHLNGAIYLRELSNEQIRDYFFQIGYSNLWQLICDEPRLIDIVKKPLLLNIIILAYEETASENWRHLYSSEGDLQYLLDAYIYRMLVSPRKIRLYTEKKTPSSRKALHWLVWLAQQMKRESITDFSIEKIQPSWLEDSRQKLDYRLVMGLLCGLAGSSIIGLATGTLVGAILGTLGGVAGGLSLGLSNKIIGRLTDNLEIRFQRFPNETIYKLGRSAIIKGIFSGLLAGFIVVILIKSFILGINIGLSIGLLVGLLFGGLTCLQHFALRLTLWRSGYIPWNYASFLDYCTERFILSRFGGSYRFIHQLIQEHFAAIL